MLTAEAPEIRVRTDDRRRGFRIRQRRPVKLFDPVSGRYFAGITFDLSATGLKLGLPMSTPVFEGRQVSVHVGHPNSSGLTPHRMMRQARIVWLRRTPGMAQTMTCGVEFEPDDLATMEAA